MVTYDRYCHNIGPHVNLILVFVCVCVCVCHEETAQLKVLTGSIRQTPIPRECSQPMASC